jgi:hypothetical protein
MAISLAVVLALVPAWAMAQAPGATVTAVDIKAGVVTAHVNSTGQVFTFKLTNEALLKSVHPGQGIYVNLGKKEISPDGKSTSGSIVTIFPVGKGSVSVSPTSGSTKSAGAPSFSPLCSQNGGASTPQMADSFGKSYANPTVCFAAARGASTTISGNIFPAGDADFIAFIVPATYANCSKHVIQVMISSSLPGAQILFDAL